MLLRTDDKLADVSTEDTVAADVAVIFDAEAGVPPAAVGASAAMAF